MTYLYLKIHNQTGFKYLGKTVSEDPHLYKGSGKVWNRHIKKHGYDVTTIILLASEDDKEIAETGKFFSKIFGVVKSKEFANIREETGDGGDTWSTNPNKEETLSKILTRTRGQKRTDQQKKNISDALNRTNTSYSGHDTKNNAIFTNKKHRNDTIEKIKISNRRFRDKSSKKNKTPEKSYNKGIPKTEEHKRKLSEALLGRKPSNSRIIVIDGKEFIGMKDASEFIGIPYSTIRNRIKSRNLHYANIYDKNNKKLVVDGRVLFEDELS